MTFEEYLKQETGQSIRALALSIGVAQSTLARQLNGERTLTLETLRDISLATDLDFLDLAIRANLITEEHAKKIRANGALLEADSMDIIDELARRLQQGEKLNNQPSVFNQHPISANGYPLTPDGQEFRPDLYPHHRLLWQRHGENWREHYTLAAKNQVDGDDIDEIYEP